MPWPPGTHPRPEEKVPGGAPQASVLVPRNQHPHMSEPRLSSRPARWGPLPCSPYFPAGSQSLDSQTQENARG